MYGTLSFWSCCCLPILSGTAGTPLRNVAVLEGAVEGLARWQLADVQFLRLEVHVPRPTRLLHPTDEKNKDLHRLYKNNIIGGPSIVFHRYHERDVTTIRPTDYEEPKACKKIIGYKYSNMGSTSLLL
jgi:hypothetical protein